jgi:hypothetical protein
MRKHYLTYGRAIRLAKKFKDLPVKVLAAKLRYLVWNEILHNKHQVCYEIGKCSSKDCPVPKSFKPFPNS